MKDLIVSVFDILANDSDIVTVDDLLTVLAYYPNHPDKKVVKKNKFYPKGLTEADVWEYYDKVKRKMLPFFEDKFVAFGVVGDNFQWILKRHKGKGHKDYIKIESIEDFDEFNNGRNVEFYIHEVSQTDVAIIDTDPGNKIEDDFDLIKEYTKEAVKVMKKLSGLDRVRILYSGKRAFHVWGFLKRKRKIDDIRDELWALLEEHFKDDNSVTITKKPKPTQMRLDISINKEAGLHIAPFSLRAKTGLYAGWVSQSKLDEFKKEEHKIDKIIKKS